jgi:hypothetical protein
MGRKARRRMWALAYCANLELLFSKLRSIALLSVRRREAILDAANASGQWALADATCSSERHLVGSAVAPWPKRGTTFTILLPAALVGARPYRAHWRRTQS